MSVFAVASEVVEGMIKYCFAGLGCCNKLVVKSLDD